MLTVGVDLGTETVKLVLADGKTTVRQSVIPHKGMSETSLRLVIDEWLREAGLSMNDIRYTVGTGSLTDIVGLMNEKVREPICVARGIGKIYPSVHTAVGIGAQKTHVLKCNEGKLVKIATGEQCAAGTGRYLEMIADLMNIAVEEIGLKALKANNVVAIASTCAVFAESDVISLIYQGKDINGILAGACQALVLRVYPLIVNVGLEKELMLYGGVARNIGVVKAMEDQLSSKVQVPEVPEVVGALGAALIAQERVA